MNPKQLIAKKVSAQMDPPETAAVSILHTDEVIIHWEELRWELAVTIFFIHIIGSGTCNITGGN